MAIVQIADLLRCPHCTEPFAVLPDRLRCPAGHSFDLARQGYLNLYGRAAPEHADSVAMVAARDRLLNGGAFAAVSDALLDLLDPHGAPAVLDCGAGTGHYLAQVLQARPGGRGIALDISVPAARSAARAHPRIGAVVADAWSGLPVATGRLDAVLSVFAPRNRAEFARVLRTGGRLLVVHPGADHLAELRAWTDLIGIAPDKAERLAADLDGAGFDLAKTRKVRASSLWSAGRAVDAVAMGPNAFHLDLDRLRAALPEQLQVTVSVQVTCWVRRSEPDPAQP